MTMQQTIKPILKYPGSKANMAEWIISYMPRTPYFIDAFCGSAAIWFALWSAGAGWPKFAVLNDLEGEITHLYRILRSPEARAALCEAVALTPWSREEYEIIRDAMHGVPDADPVERARRYLVQLWQGHGTATGGRSTVGWRHQGPQGMRKGIHTYQGWNQMPERLAYAAQALKCAEIENRPARSLIADYAAPDVLIYCDPPYLGTVRNGSLYRYEMRSALAHARLIHALRKHPGPVVLSGYHSALYDRMLAGWRCVEKDVQAEKGNTRTEVLWLNQTCIDRLGYGPMFDESETP
jgi:DNA adenine methylase